MAVLALREHQATKKGAERHRDTQERAGPGRADARQQHRQGKRLAPPAPGDEPEENRQDEPADHGDNTDRSRGLGQHLRHDGQGRSARQDRDEQQQADDAEILKEHDADDEPSMWRVELIPGAQFLQHDGGARECDEEAGEEAQAPHRRGAAERQHEEEDSHGRRRNLESAADQHLPPDPADFGEGELEADREEQQHDAHLRQHLDIVLCPDDADACWSGDGAGHDEGDDRWDPDAAQGEDEDQGDGVSQDQFGQGRVRGHASV